MTEREETEKHSDDENDDTLDLNLGVLKVRMTGQLIKTLTPFMGWSLVFIALAYAVCLVIGALHNGD